MAIKGAAALLAAFVLGAPAGFFDVSPQVLDAQAPSGRRVRINRVIEKLEAGEVVYGPQISGLSVGSAEFANDLARASHNIQYVSWDMKNGMFDLARLQTSLLGLLDRADILKRGIQHGVTSFARVPLRPHVDPSFVVGEMLDLGLTGFVFPEIDNRQQAEAAIRAMRYPHRDGYQSPAGYTGGHTGSAARAAWYWGVSEAEYKRRADVWPLNPDGELFAMVQIETVEAVKNLPDIITTPGLGAILIGPNTLTDSMGEKTSGLVTGPAGAPPKVEAVMQQIADTCLKYKVPCGIPVAGNTVAEAQALQKRRIAQGFRIMYLTGTPVTWR
ncbi:MAG: aldolase/citrate lyase family protein [Vicinamibacterales bacterium]